MKFRAGDWVEVRGKEEILGSLDTMGRLDGLPFMPQMFQYCGHQFRVYKRAHKTCDTVTHSGGRWLADGVHLDLRCDGKAHGNCEAACLIFWKEAWLKPAGTRQLSADPQSDHGLRSTGASVNEAVCTEEDVWRATRAVNAPADGGVRYVCQATELPSYTKRVRWWDIRQYVQDYRSGNVTLGRMLRGFAYAGYVFLGQAEHGSWGRSLRRIYDSFQHLWGGIPFPRKTGTIPAGQPTPTVDLDLQPGEIVRVKSYQDILATLDAHNKNAGLFFDAEQVPYCGGTYRVKAQVSQFVNEKTGRLVSLKTPAVILENVWCQSRYSSCRVFCPRSIYSWWREIWLERVHADATSECEQPLISAHSLGDDVGSNVYKLDGSHSERRRAVCQD